MHCRGWKLSNLSALPARLEQWLPLKLDPQSLTASEYFEITFWNSVQFKITARSYQGGSSGKKILYICCIFLLPKIINYQGIILKMTFVETFRGELFCTTVGLYSICENGVCEGGFYFFIEISRVCNSSA